SVRSPGTSTTLRSCRRLRDRDLVHAAVGDQVGARLRPSVAGQAEDDPLDPGPVGREVDVRLRRVRGGAGVRVIDRAELAALALDLLDQRQQLTAVALESKRARRGVDRAVDA